MQNAVGPTERTSNNMRNKRSRSATQPVAPGALEQCGVSPKKKEHDALMLRGDCSLNVLFYQWLILLEKTDKRSGGILTGRQVLFNKAIYGANGSMFPDSSSLRDKRL